MISALLGEAVKDIPYWFVKAYHQNVNELLLLRALTYFDDAEREATLPKEGPEDWAAVKDFFLARVGDLLIPPSKELKIQKRVIDVRDE